MENFQTSESLHSQSDKERWRILEGLNERDYFINAAKENSAGSVTNRAVKEATLVIYGVLRQEESVGVTGIKNRLDKLEWPLHLDYFELHFDCDWNDW